MLITIFTPTYNRAKLLPKTYESLCKQTYKNFEWIIVDDGSTDNTADIIKKFDNVGCIKIKYIFQENGGKHTAINHGVKIAEGTLFFILDSDDSLPKDSLQIIVDEYNKAQKNERFGGVCGLIANHNGNIIGSGFPKDNLVANSIAIRNKHNVTGDLREIFLTNILRKYPFPVINGEKFCPEVLVWNRIAKKYDLHCFNRVIYYADYLEGGLTDNIVKIRMKSPIATMMCYAEMINYPIPFQKKVKAAINYWRFRFCTKELIEDSSICSIWILAMPFGWFMHKMDRRMLSTLE